MSASDDRERERADFDACLSRTVEERIARGIVHTFKPVLDEGPGVRVFDTMDEYRKWCAENLPEWLGYRRVTDEEWARMVAQAMGEDQPVQSSNDQANN